MSRVPSIVNTALPDAEERLNAAVLLYSIVGKEYSNQIPADMILTQSVAGGSVVAENTIIDLVISGGAQTAEVPNVEGLYIDEAVATLENLGFLVHTETEYSGTVAEGGIITQSVRALEEHPVGETIVLTVSLGRDPDEEYEETLVSVPGFVGKTYDEALKLAQDAGLMVIAKEKAYSSEFEKDVVMHQSVEAGTQIISGNAVELTISLGIQIIKVPDVQFLTEAEAITLIENSGLVASITYETSETVKAGLVISQTPTADTETDPGAQVAIVVSKGAASFAMPNVVGMSETDAKAALLAKGISVTLNYKYSTASDLGKVLEQSIAADTQVYAGSAMMITVSTGEELFAVPNVAGMSEADAKSAITKTGFTVKVNNEYSETVPKGNVIYQAPDAGSQQSLSTAVLIVVSKGKKPIEVPDVTKMEQSLAESTLASYGFKCDINSAYSETIAAGAVISQDPKSGATAYSGDVITLVISKGREPITIPDVEGMSQSDATSTLKSAGFAVSVQQEYHNTVSEGAVFDQNPSSGTTAYKNSIVTIYISKGKAPVSPTGVTLNHNSKTLYPSGNGTTVQLTATVLPSDATDKSVTWTSSNSSIAQVSSSGLVTAVSSGTATITVKTNTGGYTATCKITVESVAVSSVSVKTPPTKTSYYVGDTLNTTGLSLTATYNNGTTKTINSGFTCSPTTLNTAGTQKITVTYEEKTTSFSVSVQTVEVTSISIATKPSKTSYYIGDTLNTSGLTLTATYNNGNIKTISSGFSCSPTTLNNSGTQKITVSYGSVSATFSVNIEIPSVTLSSSNGSSSDTHVYYGTATGGFYAGIFDLPSASSNTGSTISWSVVAGDAFINNGKLYINQPGTIVARASITYNGKSYSADYTYNRGVTVSIDTALSLRSEPRIANDTYMLTIPVGNVLNVSSLYYGESKYVWGVVSYNGKTGYVALWKKDRSESNGIIAV